MSAKPPVAVRIAILGCGNVGRALVEILTDPDHADALAARAGSAIEIVGIAVNDVSRQRSDAPWFPSHLLTDDPSGLVARDDVDLVVELLGGIEPAGSLIEAALSSGKPVVTANKALIAVSGGRLSTLAAANGVDLNFEAAVAGAIPVIRTLRESLAGERISRVMGIVNGTTNFILTKMADDGEDYDAVLAEAQMLGLAERDPSADVEGGDAAAKAAILASLAFGADISLDDVHREGISRVRTVDVAFAHRLGYAVKLLAIAEQVGPGEVSARVHPAMVPLAHPLASVGGAYNAVFIEGETCGSLMLYGQGAGGAPTASAVLGDIIDAARHLIAGSTSPAPVRDLGLMAVPMDDLRAEFYVAIDVADRPGVLATVATAFGAHSVSIRSMEQVGLGDEARLIFLTHQATERDMAATVATLEALDVVDAVGGVLRVVGVDEGVS
ncbi:MAG: homoserine dehydrogenase [Actinomycetes bacterium]